MKLSLTLDNLKPKLSKLHKDFIGFIILFAFIALALTFLAVSLDLKIKQDVPGQQMGVLENQEENNQQSPSPKPKLSGKPQNQIIQDKSGHPLCKGVTESWKLVPDPEKEGQYIICNTEKSNQMATPDELNIAVNNYRVSH